MLIHAWMYCSYYDRLLIMGDDMFIIAYEQAVIMHDQRHIHVIMNIIVNPRLKSQNRDPFLLLAQGIKEDIFV